MVQPHLKFYRVYLLDVDGSIEGTELLSAVNDADVFERIRTRGCVQPAEIWDGRRRVALIEPTPGVIPVASATSTIAA